MATKVISNEQVFPIGTSVSAYKLTGRREIPSSGAPSGTAVSTATVAADSTVTLAGLADATAYVLYASSPDRYLRTTTDRVSTSGGGSSSISGLVSTVQQGIGSVEAIYARASDFVLYASAARTATPTSVVLPDNLYGSGVRLTLDITATAATTGTITVAIQHFDPAAAAAAGRWVTVKSFTAITGSTASAALPYTVLYTIDRGAVGTTAPHEVFQNVIGRGYRAIVTHSTADSWTYSLGGTVLAP